MYCRKCGFQIGENDKFCGKCGEPVVLNKETNEDSNAGIPHKKKSPFKWITIGCILALLIVIGVILFKVITSNASANNAITGLTGQETLLSQIEKKYKIEVSYISYEEPIADGDLIIEDYLPYEGYQRYTSVINAVDGTEHVMEEMTMYVEGEDTKYSLYSNLTQTTVQGQLFLDESKEYYYTLQEALLDSTKNNTEIYIGLPGKTWTMQGTDEKQVFIAPEFYTVSTHHGNYDKCLLKYTHINDDYNELSAYAPNGMGEVLRFGWIGEMANNKEELLYYYTYNPDDSTGAESKKSQSIDDVSEGMPDDGMIIQDMLDNVDADFWMNADGYSTIDLTIQWEGTDQRLYLYDISNNKITYAGTIQDEGSDTVTVIGDSNYKDGVLVYISERELSFNVGEEIWSFVKQ